MRPDGPEVSYAARRGAAPPLETRDEPAGHRQSRRRPAVGVSGALPGSVHDKKAEWTWGLLAELEAAGLVTLADKGYQGSTWAKTPYKGKNKPESQRPTAPTRGSAAPASGQTPSSRRGRSSVSSAAAPGAPGNSPRLSTHCSSARHNQDEKGSLCRDSPSGART